MTTVALYSSIYGGYDQPKPLPSGISGTLFTDDPDICAPGWRIEVDPLLEIPTPMLRAKYWKTHPFLANPETDVALWVDGSMSLRRNDFVDLCLGALGHDELSLMRHPERNCILEEATFAARLPRYFEESLVDYANSYLNTGHPIGWGLFALGTFAVRRTPHTELLFQNWWGSCITQTYMDQITFPPLLRTSPVSWNTNIPWWTWWDYTDHLQ